jgi:hypothetical protein
MNLERYDTLLSIASEIVNKGHISDAMHFGLSDISVSVLPSGRLGMSRDDRYQHATEQYSVVQASSQMQTAVARFSRNWQSGPQGSPPEYFGELQTAFRAEFGVTVTELAEFTGVVIELGLANSVEPKRLPRHEFIQTVSGKLGWTADKIAAILERFSLVERPSFLTNEPSEVFPWRYGRELSYLRRPYLIRGTDTDLEVVWGTRHVNQAGRTLLDICQSGRLKAKATEMRRFMGSLRSIEPELFNDEVASVFDANSDLTVRSRVKKIGKLRITRENGDDIGDIDVLVADVRRRKLLAVETKDFETARTPAELSREIEKLLMGHKSANRLHAERVSWLRDHVVEVLAWLAITTTTRKWSVDGLIVVSSSLMSPLLVRSHFPIVTLDEVRRAPDRPKW